MNTPKERAQEALLGAASRIEQLERQNADLLTALRACCGVLSGENMQKSSLVRALELSYVALANAKGEQTAATSKE